jgi:thiol-disulfide isomerase/thioredoxin
MCRAALLAVALLATSCAAGRAAQRPSTLLGKPLEVSAPDLEGRDHDVGAQQGKVRVVDFWATWCDPCRDQLPFLDRLATEYGERGLSVYAVAFDEDRGALERFLQETPVSFTVLWDKGGASLAEPLQLTRLPTTLLVDRRGVVRDVHLGFERGEEPKLEEAVRRLLSE